LHGQGLGRLIAKSRRRIARRAELPHRILTGPVSDLAQVSGLTDLRTGSLSCDYLHTLDPMTSPVVRREDPICQWQTLRSATKHSAYPNQTRIFPSQAITQPSITRSCVFIGIEVLEGRCSDKPNLPRITATPLVSCITSQQTTLSERRYRIADVSAGVIHMGY